MGQHGLTKEPRKGLFSRLKQTNEYDDSARTFPCTFIPHIYAEPLYFTPTQEEEGNEEFECSGSYENPLPDGSLFRAQTIEALDSVNVELYDDDIEPDIEEIDAWETAREEAQANHYI